MSQADVPSTILTTNMLQTIVTGEDNWQAEVRDSVLYLETSNQIPMDDVMIDFAITSPNVHM